MIALTRCVIVLPLLFSTACAKTAATPTAADNVEILPPFVMTKLGTERTVRIYLPPSYATSEEHYPVIYMHDGQNLFDDVTAYSGEWGVDETLNEKAATSNIEFIVVGIDNGGDKRMNELSPWPNADFGDAVGEAYMDFIARELKPAIDEKYRTLGDRDHTAIIGSSMGA